MTDKQLFKLIMNDGNKEKLIYSLGREVQQLEKENRQLKFDLNTANAKIFEYRNFLNEYKDRFNKIREIIETDYD